MEKTTNGALFSRRWPTGRNPCTFESLQLEKLPQDVRLTWAGDESTYVIYRSEQSTAVDSPSNEISRAGSLLFDDPLLGIPCSTCFYLVSPVAGFACGELTCSIETEYCQVLYPGVPKLPPQHSCQAIPSECLTRPTCACLEGGAGGRWPPPVSDCSQSPDGAITVGLFAP